MKPSPFLRHALEIEEDRLEKEALALPKGVFNTVKSLAAGAKAAKEEVLLGVNTAAAGGWAPSAIGQGIGGVVGAGRGAASSVGAASRSQASAAARYSRKYKDNPEMLKRLLANNSAGKRTTDAFTRGGATRGARAGKLLGSVAPAVGDAVEMGMKVAKKNHPLDRLKQRAPGAAPGLLPAIEQFAQSQDLDPRRTYHSPLPGGAHAVLGPVGKKNVKHVVKTVFSPGMSPPGTKLVMPPFAKRFEEQEKKVRGKDQKLWDAASDLPVEQLSVDELYQKYRKKKTWGRSPQGGPNIGNRGTISPLDIEKGKADAYSLYQHRRLIDEADTSYPIIMQPNGRVLDGVHRIMKAKQMGSKTMPAVVLKTAGAGREANWDALPPKFRKGLRKRLAAKAKQNEGFDPGPSKQILHGSPNKIDKFELRRHFLADDSPVVFGTPERAMALTHLQPWNDDDFSFGSTNGGPLTMAEKRPGAFEETYGGKSGYLYSLDPKGFKYDPKLMRSERLAREVPGVLKVEKVKDALAALESSGLKLVKKAAKAVIIKGNPGYIGEDPTATKFYTDLARQLTRRGYDDVAFDPGKPFTSPPEADLWVGHSRGADRLRFAPPGTKTIDLGPLEHPKSVKRYQETRRLAEERGIPYSQLPLKDRSPVPEHYQVTPGMLAAFDRVKKAAPALMYAVGNHDKALEAGRALKSPKVYTAQGAKKARKPGQGVFALQVPKGNIEAIQGKPGSFRVTRGHPKLISKVQPYKKTAPTPRGVDKIKAWRQEAGSVGSSHLDAVKYDKGSKKLQVLFRSGALYEYDDVSAQRAKVLQSARSKGKYFHDNIRSKPYSYRRLA